MAVSDNMVVVLAILALNYGLIYRRGWMGRVIADILFITIGIASYLIFTTQFPWGVLVAIIGLIDGVFNVLNP